MKTRGDRHEWQARHELHELSRIYGVVVRSLVPKLVSISAIRVSGVLGLVLALLTIPSCTRERSCCQSAAQEEAGKLGSLRASLESVTASPWLPPNQREEKLPFSVAATNQDGQAVRFEDFVGKPVALSFIYTRCTNPNKCARVSDTMAGLRSESEKAGLGGKVRLLLISYDPEFDTPAVLKDYGLQHGLRCDQGTMLLRLDPNEKGKFFDDLEVAVNFNRSGVNIHGLQLLLFDKKGRLARLYRTLIWDNGQVLKDLQLLVEE